MPPNSKRPWTPDEDAKIIELEVAKVPRRDMADRLERTQAGVEARIMRLRRQGRL